jgi:hypothetical protein
MPGRNQVEPWKFHSAGKNPSDSYAVSEGFEGNSFIVATKLRGSHGYLPTIPAFYTGLIASGYGINPGVQIPIARQIDIAPTIARLLGLKKNIEGTPLVGLLK